MTFPFLIFSSAREIDRRAIQTRLSDPAKFVGTFNSCPPSLWRGTSLR
jgi:hypothetical protein